MKSSKVAQKSITVFLCYIKFATLCKAKGKLSFSSKFQVMVIFTRLFPLISLMIFSASYSVISVLVLSPQF